MRTITREHLLWIFLALIAAATRLTFADFPLGEAEASSALAALQTARGDAAVLTNPFFGMLQSVALSLFGDSDVVARSAALIAGIGLCLWPMVMRSMLGRERAWVLALLLCLSPTATFVGRDALGGGLAWLIAAIIVGVGEMRAPVRAAMIGVLVACGIDGVGPMAAVVLMFLMSGRSGELRALLQGRSAAAFGAAFVAAATGLLWRPAGVADVFAGWAAWWNSGRDAQRHLIGVIAGEAPVMLCAILAALRALVRRVSENYAPVVDGPSFRFGAAWMSAGLLVLLLLPSHGAAAAMGVTIGIAMLASEPLTLLWQRLRAASGWVTWATFGLTFVLLQFVGLGLRSYAMQNEVVYLLPIVAAIVMIAGVTASAALNEEAGTALRGIAAAAVVVAATYTVAAGQRLTQRGWDRPEEPYVVRAPQQGLVTLADAVRQAAVRASSEPDGVALFVDDSAPAALRWALRAQTKVRYGAQIGTQDMALLPAAKKPAESRAFVGSRFRIERTGSLAPADGGAAALLRWLLFRQGGVVGAADVNWTLWVSDSLAAEMSGRR
jgi:hypothetical protein